MSRRVSVRDHEDWRHSLLQPQDYDAIDEIDLAAAESGFRQRRKGSEVSKLEALLDELAAERKEREG